MELQNNGEWPYMGVVGRKSVEHIRGIFPKKKK